VKPEPTDFRPPELPGDRVLALEAIIDAKGQKLPGPPVCHGKANCCACPACEPSKHKRRRLLAA
jgi:hypothetical protein